MEREAALFADAKIDRDRDKFLRELLRDLSGMLEDSVGVEEAETFIAMVGSRMGVAMNADYRAAAETDRLDVNQVAAALVDLKARIQGGFSVESIDEDKIVLVNTACPFGRLVVGRPSLCMMTSNVFGRITADNLGYAQIDLEETIARGHSGCRVVVYLKPEGQGREYFG